MYHSITIGDKNTWDDWHLVAKSRPVINPPKQKTKYLDIPGASGSIDMSESLTGYPVFDNREGDFEFYVMNGYLAWNVLLEEISKFLHGKRMRLILEDEPEYYYEGRFAVDEWKSEKDYSKIVISYNLEPYKYWKLSSTEDWLWDPFNFQNGVIQTKAFKDIVVASDDDWTVKEFEAGLLDRAPICPIISVSTTSGNGMDIHFVSVSQNIDITKHVPDGNHQEADIYFSNSDFTMSFKGAGTVSLVFRSGKI